jgi:hypothetical protein
MTYTISERGIKIAKRNMLYLIISAGSIGSIMGIFAIFYTLNDIELSFITGGIVVLFIALFLFFELKIVLKSIEKKMKGICYILENGHLIIKQNNYEQFNISSNEIKFVNKYRNNILIIILNNNKRINVNKYLESYDSFISELKCLSVVNEINKNPFTILNILSAIIGLIVTGIFLWSNYLIPVIISGILIFLLYLYLFIPIITSQHIEPKKKRMVCGLILILFIIIEKIMRVL